MCSVIAARFASQTSVASSSQTTKLTSRARVEGTIVIWRTHGGVPRGACFSQIPRSTPTPSGKRSMVSGLSRRYGRMTGATAR
jgi:hypothetical protein